jgi:hypothetical protein
MDEADQRGLAPDRAARARDERAQAGMGIAQT